jgi:hypothetical protein
LFKALVEALFRPPVPIPSVQAEAL